MLLLRALCARAWPVLTGHRRAHDWAACQRRGRVGVMLWCASQSWKTKGQAGDAPLLRPKLSSLLYFFAPSVSLGKGPRMVDGRFPGFAFAHATE